MSPVATPRRTALVTGAARGLGAATAERLAEDGYKVCIHYRNHESEARRLLGSLPGDGHTALHGDLTDPAEARQVFDAAVAALGRVDVLVSNAGQWIEHRVTDTSYEDWQTAWSQTLAVNLIAGASLAWAMSQHLLRREEGSEGGRIIFVGSRGAYRGEPEAPAYGAAKAGVHALAQSLAVALGPHDVGVYAVAPGVIATELTSYLLEGELGRAISAQSPFGRVGKPEEVASAIAWLASGPAIWASGGVLDLNGASYLR